MNTTDQELQQLREQLTDLERIYGDVNHATYTAVHQLKRSLSLILGFSDWLTKTWLTLEPAEVEKYLRIIFDAGQEMNGTIDELLLQVHVRDEHQPRNEPLEMGAVVAEALGRLRYIVERKNAQVSTVEIWPAVNGYAPWIEEVWYTLISETLWIAGDGAHLALGGEATTTGGRFWVRIENGDQTVRECLRQAQPSALVLRILTQLGGALERTADCALAFTLGKT